MATKRVVMIAVDPSENSDRAFSWLLDNFHREGDKICIAHVHQLPNLPVVGIYAGGAVLSEGYQQLIQESVDTSRKCADKYKTQLEGKKIPHVVHLVTMEGSVGETICKLAKEHQASLIVMGSRGMGAVRRTFLGSVSDYVIHHAHIPTLVIPPPHTN